MKTPLRWLKLRRGRKMESDDQSQDSLLLATKRLRFLLQALTEAREREQCKHDWEIFFPAGPRDNGEIYNRCKRCGEVK